MTTMRILAPLLMLALIMCGSLAAAQAQRPSLGAYSTKAGLMPVGENPEAPTAELFYIAYTLDGADPGRRPITFVFNGGPGAASVYLHMAAIGPMTVAMAGDGSFPSVPARLQPNPYTWLHFTDLVFIDPVDTGYSRALPGPKGVADATPYFEVEGDMRSLAQFMRRYLTTFGRWPSPKAVAGESYGGQRVAGLAKMLMEDYDINLNRAVMISPALRAALPGFDSRYGLISTMTMLPSQAAIAAFHRRNDLPADFAALPQALAEVERYALGDYLTGMANLGRSTPEQKAALFGRVAALTGLDRELVASQNGRVSADTFVKELMRKQYKLIDRYDGTQASDDPLPEHPEFATLDRSLLLLNGVLSAPFQDYLRQKVGYKSERVYNMLNLKVNMRWNRTKALGTPEDLAYALTVNPDLKALVLHGYHDLSTPYFLSRYLVEQSVLSPKARQRVFFGTYPGGHMFYLQAGSREQMFKDVAGFYR